MSPKIIFYAPNVHTGGGLVLLKLLLSSVPDDFKISFFLDQRAKPQLSLPLNAHVRWVKRSALDRLAAERELAKIADPSTLVFCFHGLPPVFRNAARVIVFLQNKILLTTDRISRPPIRIAIRWAYERTLAFVRRREVDAYLVQTPTMKRAVIDWYRAGGGNDPTVHVAPFADFAHEHKPPPEQTGVSTRYDFVFPASGERHKGHATLLEAWKLLADDGLRPSLALTVPKNDTVFLKTLSAYKTNFGLNVSNLGVLSHDDLMDVYAASGALIFPSLTESFGLPLIEAEQVGLPVLAGELDYVRDVCSPSETFDPRSSVSIARAVKRYMGKAETTSIPMSPSSFWKELLTEWER